MYVATVSSDSSVDAQSIAMPAPDRWTCARAGGRARARARAGRGGGSSGMRCGARARRGAGAARMRAWGRHAALSRWALRCWGPPRGAPSFLGRRTHIAVRLARGAFPNAAWPNAAPGTAVGCCCRAPLGIIERGRPMRAGGAIAAGKARRSCAPSRAARRFGPGRAAMRAAPGSAARSYVREALVLSVQGILLRCAVKPRDLNREWLIIRGCYAGSHAASILVHARAATCGSCRLKHGVGPGPSAALRVPCSA
jgi:hypothetical protein